MVGKTFLLWKFSQMFFNMVYNYYHRKIFKLSIC